MPIDMPLNWSPTQNERVRAVSIKMPNLFLVVMLIVYALCCWAMIDAFQHTMIYPFDLGPA